MYFCIHVRVVLRINTTCRYCDSISEKAPLFAATCMHFWLEHCTAASLTTFLSLSHIHAHTHTHTHAHIHTHAHTRTHAHTHTHAHAHTHTHTHTEALWQPARKRPAGETLRPIYVFSTHLANKAAEWVIRGKYDNIIQFHHAQPKGPGFLRLPEAVPQKPPVGGETETKTGDRGRKLTETTDSEDTPAKGSKPAQRRSSRLSTDESRHESPRVTRLRSHKNVSQSADSEEPDAKTPPPSAPPPPVRSSRRLRSRQQPGSVSPPPPSPPPPESPPPPAPSRRTR